MAAKYSRLSTEEPEVAVAQSDTDTDKETSVNISATCSTNNLCTGRRMYMLLVAGIVSIFVFVATFQTVLKAVVIVAAVAIIVLISYVIYRFYVNKRADQTTQKNCEASTNEKKQEEDTESTTSQKMNTGDIEWAAWEETLHDCKTSEEDDVEIIDSPTATGRELQSDDAVNKTSVIITEVDTSSDDETQEDPSRRSVSGNQATPSELLRMLGYRDPDIELRAPSGHFVAGATGGMGITSLVFSRHTGAVGVAIGHAASYSIQDHMEPYFDAIAKEMPADWQQLARNLGVPWAQIRTVDRQHSGDCWTCCQEVLNMWRRNNGRQATREVLIQAVKDTGHQDVVEKLDEILD